MKEITRSTVLEVVNSVFRQNSNIITLDTKFQNLGLSTEDVDRLMCSIECGFDIDISAQKDILGDFARSGLSGKCWFFNCRDAWDLSNRLINYEYSRRLGFPQEARL